MKVWCVAIVSLVIVAMATQATAAGETVVKGGNGETLAVVVLCSECAPGTARSKKECREGTEQGWMNGKPCGQCLLASNRKTRLKYPYDLHFSGILKDAAGHPVKDRFVKLFTANGWSVRTRTSEQGSFRLMLGATDERKSKEPVVTDLGTMVDSQPGGKDALFAMFLLPSPYEACAEGSGAPMKTPRSKQKKP